MHAIREEQVLNTYKTRVHAQLSVTLLPQAVSQPFRRDIY